jgi:DNA-binding transcriptional MocR family regulator
MLELAARYRVPIVEDDTYRELALTGGRASASLFTLDSARTGGDPHQQLFQM